MTEENVVLLLERLASDDRLRGSLSAVGSPAEFSEAAATLGFNVHSHSVVDVLSDAELDGSTSSATDRTCYGTTDCCHTKHTCFGTTSCCH